MKYDPFFIIGTKRGGTTLLRLMLNKNSSLAIPPESHFFMPLLRRFAPEQQLDENDLIRAKEIVINHSRFNTWSIDETRFDEMMNSLKHPCSLSLFITALFEQEIKNTGKERWGDKTPEYVDIIPEISQLFPQAKFIALSRDGNLWRSRRR